MPSLATSAGEESRKTACSARKFAAAALVGRPWVMALAAGGEAALTRMLGLMKQDMRTALGLTGIPHARDVNRTALLED